MLALLAAVSDALPVKLYVCHTADSHYSLQPVEGGGGGGAADGSSMLAS